MGAISILSHDASLPEDLILPPSLLALIHSVVVMLGKCLWFWTPAGSLVPPNSKNPTLRHHAPFS